MKKYTLLKEDSIIHYGITLYRIQTLHKTDLWKKGQLMGYLEKEENLSQDGICMVYNNAKVYGDARVSDNAKVYGDARVYGDAKVSGDAWVSGNARVFDNAQVFGDARVSDNAKVYGGARVSGYALIYSGALIYGNTRISGDAQVYGGALIYGNARISGNARVFGNARLYGDKWNESPLQIQGSKHYVNMATKTSLSIGCEQYPIDKWLEMYKKLGKKHEYTKDQIKEYKKYIQLANEMYNLMSDPHD